MTFSEFFSSGLDTQYILGISENATKEERGRAENLLVTCGKLICILCNQVAITLIVEEILIIFRNGALSHAYNLPY